MVNETATFKSDKFRKSRGGYSRWFLISCEKCKQTLFVYQKDGPGLLKRLYLDRMYSKNKTNFNKLICGKCKAVLGLRTMYRKERRPVYRLFAGSVEKEIINQRKADCILRGRKRCRIKA